MIVGLGLLFIAFNSTHSLTPTENKADFILDHVYLANIPSISKRFAL